MYNLNFASNETWKGASSALYYLFHERLWQNGGAKNQLQNSLAKQFGVEDKQVAFTLAARSALQILLQELKLPKESNILVQAFTCEAVVLPIIANNLKPIYVDIEPETWSMDLKDLKEKADKNTRVLILQHTFGMRPKNRQKIIDWAEKNMVIVIEDLAHGFSPRLLKEESNTHKLLSFGRSKFFSSVHGGALVITDQNLAKKVNLAINNLPLPDNDFIEKTLFYKLLTPFIKLSYCCGGKILHHFLLKTKIFNREISETERHGDYDPWLNKQLPNVFAALVLPQINNFFCKRRARKKIAKYYHQEIKDKLLAEHLPCLRYPILVKDPQKTLEHLKKKKIILGDWYRQVVAPVGLDLDKVQYQAGSCPLAEKYCKHVINLPLNIKLRLAKRIIKYLKEDNVS